MCRRDQLLGFCAAAFGLGLLIGHCFESGFLSVSIGIGLIIAGFCMVKHK